MCVERFPRGADAHPSRWCGLFVSADVILDGDHALRIRVFLLPYAQGHRAPVNVSGEMDTALLFGQRNPRGIPAVSTQPRSIVDRKPEIVPQFRAGPALQLIL